MRNEGAGRALLAGSSFDVTDAAFMLREGSPHLEALNRAILLTRESGLQQRIQERWFPNLE